tara:strand:- start:1281 stop:1928 length:648 start_codon:yes stop_codon:yes gene_type:complete
MEVKEVQIQSVAHDINNATVVKSKRERFVCKNKNFHYKVWVQNWTQGDILKFALQNGYYNADNASALVNLLIDETGQRGYITKNGLALGNSKSWEHFCKNTHVEQRKKFILSLLDNSLVAKGIFVDLVPSNVILCDGKISLIDLDSFNSFNLVFRGKKEDYEKFDLGAWWKPFETANRDTDAFYRSYVSQCLGIDVDFKINSEDAIKRLINLVRA